jgi:hypothetical protein
VHEKTRSKGSHQNLWRFREAKKNEKGVTPGQKNIHYLANDEEKRSLMPRPKRDKEKIEISVDGKAKKVYIDDIC